MRTISFVLTGADAARLDAEAAHLDLVDANAAAMVCVLNAVHIREIGVLEQARDAEGRKSAPSATKLGGFEKQRHALLKKLAMGQLPAGDPLRNPLPEPEPVVE